MRHPPVGEGRDGVDVRGQYGFGHILIGQCDPAACKFL